MVIALLGVYIVILGLMILTLFQGHRCVRNVNCKLCVLIFVICALNVVRWLHSLEKNVQNMICLTLVCIQGG